MNVTAEQLFGTQKFRNADELLHGVIGALDDAGAEEEAFDVVALVELSREEDDFFGSEAGARSVAGNAVDAVAAIVDAIVREKEFQQRDTAAIGGVAVANANAIGIPEAAFDAGTAGTAAGAGGVVLGGVSEDAKLGADLQNLEYSMRNEASAFYFCSPGGSLHLC